MPFILPEPERLEDKPPFDALPRHILEQIGDVAGSAVTGGDIVYGGFSPSAGYVLNLQNGNRVFVKGTHPNEMSHGTATMRQEISIYQNINILKKIAPRYLGMASDGNEDGWMLGVWNYIERTDQKISATGLVDILVAMQSDQSAKEKLEPAEKRNFIEFFFQKDRKWQRIAEEKKIRDKFVTLFQDQQAGVAWLDRNLKTLCELQSRIDTLQSPRGLLHGDLRLDNVVQDKTGHLYIVDWPNACYGPLVFDTVFLFAHASACGYGSVDDLFGLYRERGGAAISREDRHVMMAVIAGFFADQAYRQVPERLPRLRWMQKIMLHGLLQALSLDGVIESTPEFAG